MADAVSAQPDMEIVGVSKTKPSFEAYIAKRRGFPLYIADPAKRASPRANTPPSAATSQ